MDDFVAFGAWLKRRRKALDLTQAALAARVGVAPTTIEKIESELRRPSAHTARRLAEILEIASDERQTFIGWARGEQRGDGLPALPAGMSSSAGAARTHSLPIALTSFIGREAELAGLRALLEQPDVRLVTVTGVGGAGKTRLALEVVRTLHADFTDGIGVVDLAAVTDPGLVVSTIAAACDVHPTAAQPIVERLRSYLAQKLFLLLLDNFEQVAAAAPLLTELLAAAERLKILVTSRVVLRLSGEHIYLVPPLVLPPEASELSAEQLTGSDAVRLFVERARAQGVDTAAGVAELHVVADICRQLDGLPLAIELAAARTRLLAPPELLARMEQRLPLLTGGPRDLPARQQTVRDTIAWSFELLEPAEQRLLTNLGVFAGGCTVAAVAAVCGEQANGSLDVLDGIASLLDKSLIQRRDDPGELRVTMLETIREYALERAAEDGVLPLLRERHARYFLDLAVTAERHLRGRQQELWCNRLDDERRNLRAALDWFVGQREVEHALQLGAALWWYWMLRGQRHDGCRQLLALLELARLEPPVSESARATHARVTLGAGSLSAVYDDFDSIDFFRAVEYIQESVRLFRRSDDTWGLAWALAFAALYQSEDEQAQSWTEESRRLFEKLEDPWGQAFALVCDVRLPRIDPGSTESFKRLEHAVYRFRDLGDSWGMDFALFQLAMAAWGLGDSEAEERILRECLALGTKQGDRERIALSTNQLADVLRWQCRYQEALTLYIESQAMFRELGMVSKRAASIHGLGYARLGLGDLNGAAQCFGECLALFRSIEHLDGIGWCCHGLAGVAARRSVQGAAQAARLLGAAVNLTSTRMQWKFGPQQEYERVWSSARAQLDEQTWESLFAEGQAMSLPEALTVAYGVIELAE